MQISKHVSHERPTGIILAGGKSSRFGSDKALFEYQGKKLIEYAIDVLRPICGEILISTNQPELYSFSNLKTVSDIYSGCGPVAGIHACLLQSGTTENLIAGCDMPWLNTALFNFLLSQSVNYDVVIPVHGRFKETMASYYHKSAVNALGQALECGRFKILDAIEGLSACFANVDSQDFYSEKLFANINRISDIMGDGD